MGRISGKKRGRRTLRERKTKINAKKIDDNGCCSVYYHFSGIFDCAEMRTHK